MKGSEEKGEVVTSIYIRGFNTLPQAGSSYASQATSAAMNCTCLYIIHGELFCDLHELMNI
jgi:hypothetical protein